MIYASFRNNFSYYTKYCVLNGNQEGTQPKTRVLLSF